MFVYDIFFLKPHKNTGRYCSIPRGRTLSVAWGVLQDPHTSIIDAEEVREEHPCTHCCATTLTCCNITKERKEPALSFLLHVKTGFCTPFKTFG